MTWLADHGFHLLLIAAYLAVLARHALVGQQHVRSLDDYLIAGRRMGGIVIALSFYATFMSTNTFIGAAGKSWDTGLSWCVGGIVLSIMACASWFLVAPKFVPLTRSYGSLTVADFLGSHYESQRVRQISAGIVAISSVFYLIAIYRGASLALENFLGIPYVGCLLTVMVIVTLYTLLGGFESVVLTDALQGVLMLVGAVAMMGAMLHAGGGISTILQTLKSQDPRLVSFTDGRGLSLAMAYSLSVGVKFLVEPRQLSRFYGLKDISALRIASIVAPLAIFVTYVCLLPMGTLARTIIPIDDISATETDQVVPHLLGQSNLLGPVTSTLFLLVLLSAAMSSIDSVLLVAASTIDRDLRSVPTPDDRATRAVQRTRIWVVVVSATAATAALLPQTRDIVEMTAFSGSLYGACFLPALVVGLFLRRRVPAAAIISMLVGASVVVVSFVLRKSGLTTWHEVYPGVLAGMAAFAVCAAIRSKRSTMTKD